MSKIYHGLSLSEIFFRALQHGRQVTKSRLGHAAVIFNSSRH